MEIVFINYVSDMTQGFVDTVEKETKKIKEYIQNQMKAYELTNQLTMDDIDLFTGSK